MTESTTAQPSGPSLLHVMLYALAMCALCLAMTRVEPAPSVPLIQNFLYGFAGIFALFVVGILGYAMYATRGDEPESAAE